ncbi:hypothetical protein RUND412_009053 [Rhizina undulata]
MRLPLLKIFTLAAWVHGVNFPLSIAGSHEKTTAIPGSRHDAEIYILHPHPEFQMILTQDFAAYAASSTADPQENTTQNGPYIIECETMSHNPYVSDILQAVKTLSLMPHDAKCIQRNTHGNICTTVYKTGSAAVGICGPAQNFHILCYKLGKIIQALVNKCQEGEKAGGQAYPDGKASIFTVIVFNADDMDLL